MLTVNEAIHRPVDYTAPTKKEVCGQLGRFLLTTLLGQGAFGRVYRAFDPQLERYVAIKSLQFSKDDTKRVQRFLIEAKAAAQLRHPNIVPTFESGIINGKYYICQQLIDGKTLSEEMKTSHDSRRIVRFIADSANALFYAHSQGIIHRDIKPENIMIDIGGNPQIMDFGLAKRLDDISELTTDGTLMGTPSYMSPEQASGKTDTVNAASDQYSLGVILYESLAKRRPFQGRPHAVIHQVINDQPVSPTSLNQNVDQDIEAVCLKAMSKSIGDRYSNCYELSQDLENWLHGRPTHARPLGSFSKIWRWCKRERLLATSVFGIGMLLLAITIFLGFVALWQTQAKEQIAAEKKAAEKATQDAVESENLAKHQTEIAKKAFAEADLSKKTAEENLRKFVEEQKATKLLRKKVIEREQDVDDATEDARESQEEAKLATKEKTLANYQKQLVDIYDAASSHPEFAQRLLDGCPTEWRGWEWYFLKSCTTKSKHLLPLNGEKINIAKPSPDGSLIALGMQSGSVWVFDTQSQEFLFKEKIHSQVVIAIAFSADNHLVATSSQDKSLRVLERGEDEKTFSSIFQQRYKNALFSLAVSPSRKLATSPQSNGGFVQTGDSVQIWSIDSEKIVERNIGRDIQSEVSCLAFDGFGKRLAIGSYDQTLMIWDLEKNRLLATSKGYNKSIVDVKFEPNGKSVLVRAANDNQLFVYDVNKRNVRRLSLGLPRGTKFVNCSYSWIRNESIAMTGSELIWRQRIGWNSTQALSAVNSSMENVVSSSRQDSEQDRSQLLCYLQNGFAFAREESGSYVIYLHPEGPLPETNLLSRETDKSTVSSVGLANGELIAIDEKGTVLTLNAIERRFAVDLRKQGTIKQVAPYYFDKQLPVITPTGQLKNFFSIEKIDGRKASNRFTKLLATQHLNQTLVVDADNRFGFAVPNTANKTNWLGKAEEDASIFSTDVLGRALISASNNGKVQYWNLDEERPVAKNLQLKTSINSIQLGAQGESFVVACNDRLIRRFVCNDLSLAQEYRGHYGSVIDSVILPGHRRVVSVGDDDTIRIWDLISGVELLRIRHPTNGITNIYVTLNEQMIICQKQNGEFLCWDAGSIFGGDKNGSDNSKNQ